jgi:hypothetical protein
LVQRDVVASKHQEKVLSPPSRAILELLAVVILVVVVVDVRKWTAPTSPQKNLQKKDERYSRLAVLGPGRLLVLLLLCRDREEMLTRTQAGADLDRTALTLSPATTRRHTPRPHHRGVL